jgi:hypothetical protein
VAARWGSFGAVLATDTDILVECGGRVYGSDPRSFRAEGYGILAILRLTFHLRYFYVTRNRRLKFRLYCDSESLLKRIAASRALQRHIPRRFLHSEVDVEMQILAAIDALTARLDLEHVEGHQDTKYLPLPWAAQLNQRCDELATAHLDSATTPLPAVPFLPASTVSVSVRTHTITHHIPTQLRTFAGLPGMKAHLANHHDWSSPAVFDLVDWPLFHAVTLSTSFLKRLFVIKWMNALLPFQQQQFKFKQSPSTNCPSACWCNEDWKHFLRCPHQQRRQGWTEFIPIIASAMERYKLDPSLRRILLHMIIPLTTLPPIPLRHLADQYTTLLTTQRSIGLDSLFFGFFFTNWVHLQDRYLKTLGLPRSKNEANCAIRSLIILCHDQCHGTWLLRNQHLHGSDPANITCYKHLHLLAQIKELYDAAPHTMAHNRDLFSFPFETRHFQSTAILKAFYTHAKPIVEVSLKGAAQLGTRFQSIDTYFRPVISAELFNLILGR